MKSDTSYQAFSTCLLGSNDALGKIMQKTDIGNYVYNNQKIHQLKYLTTISGGGTDPTVVIGTDTRELTYTAFLKPASITEGDYELSYTYGSDRQRLTSTLKQNGTTIEEKLYWGDVELLTKGGITREIYYIAAGNGLNNIIVKQGSTISIYYAYTDQLGSIVAVTDEAGTIVAEQNFDAWGRYRNPADWTYTGIPANPDWLYRGFTGHEHITVMAFFKGGLDPTSSSARQKAWRNFDPTAPWSATNKAFKIDMGQFKTDPNRNFAERAFQLFSRFTWELPQTIAGNYYSHFRNLTGNVTNVDYYGGATLVNGNTNNPDDRWGVTLGSYINGMNLVADPYQDEIFRHEYGHTLQSRLVGPLYLISVGLPSFIGQGLDDIGLNDHNREWYETQANRMAYRYFDWFEPNALDPDKGGIEWNFNEYPTKYNPNWYWMFSHPPILFSWWLLF